MSDSNREMWGHLSPKEKEGRRKDEELEALRRRVAELEGERDTALVTAEVAQAELLKCREVRNASHELQKLHFQESKRLHGRIESLTAENAELKRQVEALREDAEVGRLVKQLVEQTGEGSGVVELWKDMGVYCYSNAYSARVVAQFPSLIETLREAAKGEVE